MLPGQGIARAQGQALQRVDAPGAEQARETTGVTGDNAG